MRPWLKTGGYRTFLSERGWVKGDFKVSIDSEFVFRNQIVFESTGKIEVLNNRPWIVLRATTDFNNRDILLKIRDDRHISPVAANVSDS